MISNESWLDSLQGQETCFHYLFEQKDGLSLGSVSSQAGYHGEWDKCWDRYQIQSCAILRRQFRPVVSLLQLPVGNNSRTHTHSTVSATPCCSVVIHSPLCVPPYFSLLFRTQPHLAPDSQVPRADSTHPRHLLSGYKGLFLVVQKMQHVADQVQYPMLQLRMSRSVSIQKGFSRHNIIPCT